MKDNNNSSKKDNEKDKNLLKHVINNWEASYYNKYEPTSTEVFNVDWIIIYKNKSNVWVFAHIKGKSKEEIIKKFKYEYSDKYKSSSLFKVFKQVDNCRTDKIKKGKGEPLSDV